MINNLRKWKSRITDTLDSLGTTPAWTSVSEQKFLASYARSEYSGRGEIVDLGCLFGATTIALARGLRRNTRITNKDFRIHSFDWFRWESAFKEYPGNLHRSYQDGESFYPEFLQNIRHFRQHVAPYPFDLMLQGWSGGDIEFIIADSTKSFELCEKIVKSFYARLIPGVSLLLEQDFVHWYCPWIHLATFRLRNSVIPVRLLPKTTSVLFKIVSEVNPELVTETHLRNCSDEEVTEAFEYCLKLVPNTKGWESASILADKIGSLQEASYLRGIERRKALGARNMSDFSNFCEKA